MNPHLMFPDRDFDPRPPAETADLRQDLNLDPLLDAMAGGDEYLRAVAEAGLLAPVGDPEILVGRQEVLVDCLAQTDLVRELYDLATDTLEHERRNYFPLLSRTPDVVVTRSVEVLEMFLDRLHTVVDICARLAPNVGSEALVDLCAMVRRELGDGFFGTATVQLRLLHFRDGVAAGAALGVAHKGTDYRLREPPHPRWWQRLVSIDDEPTISFTIPERDVAGGQALTDLRRRELFTLAGVLADVTDHVHGLFAALRAELGFYLAAANLYRLLVEAGERVCFPEPLPMGTRQCTGEGVYDPTLAIAGHAVVGNTVAVDGQPLVVITGANQGGKTTFLRTIGIAQLMMQAGLFVAADDFHADTHSGVFTHFTREEDAGLDHGKLDEELHRMDHLVETMASDALLLCNESFSSTNEYEGSALAGDILDALVDTTTTVYLVTHMYALATRTPSALHLRAERRPGGLRTHRIVPGAPEPTSYGADLYAQVFGAPPHPLAGST